MSLHWEKKAVAEGRICPECKNPVPKWDWEIMTKTKGIINHCWTCRYAHWEIKPIHGAGGSAGYDNRDRDDFTYIRRQYDD